MRFVCLASLVLLALGSLLGCGDSCGAPGVLEPGQDLPSLGCTTYSPDLPGDGDSNGGNSSASGGSFALPSGGTGGVDAIGGSDPSGGADATGGHMGGMGGAE